jgi:Ser/Thr protein kinase RdoA (MazF antagonist)
MVNSGSYDRTRDIAAVLANYPPDCQPTRVESLGAAGGMSGAQFWRLATPRGGQILRRWPTEFPPPERLRFIHGVLRHAADGGIAFLPIPATTRAGNSFVEFAGYLWEVAPLMPGAADYEQSPSAEKLRAAMIALAQFHDAVAGFSVGREDELPPAIQTNAIARHAQRLQEFERSSTVDLANAIVDMHWPDLAPLARQFLQNLRRAVPFALKQIEPLTGVVFPQQPCIRDAWHDHVLFTGNKVTGLIDFGAVDFDTPATDIARLLGSFESVSGPSDTTWQIGLDAYQSVHKLFPGELQAARALRTSGTLLAGYNWIRWIYIEHREFEDHAQVVARFRRILASVTTTAD